MSNLTAYHKDVFSAKICPCCKSGTKTVSEEFIYGKKFTGKTMICCVNYPSCDAYVGTHAEDGAPLGRLARKPLRMAKKEAHSYFDRIWLDQHMTRPEAYDWLCDELGIDRDHTHIGWFSIETCQKVVQLSKKYLQENG